MRYATSIFCDDIRREVGGKISLMGIVSGVLGISQDPPVVLPKFGIFTTIVTPVDDPFQFLNLRIYAFDELIMESKSERMPIIDYPADYPVDDPTTLNVIAHHEFPNFAIPKLGSVMVEVETERETLKAGRLHIISASELAKRKAAAKEKAAEAKPE